MPEIRRIPPGRAGRLWLTARLETARRAATLLDRKLRILRAEQERHALLTHRSHEAWTTAQQEADSWIGRAAALAGQRSIRLATPRDDATVTVEYATIMGSRYPTAAAVRPPKTGTGDWAGGSAALIAAKRAYQDALAAAVAHAAAATARRTIDREAAVTRQRLHAITKRWTPRVERALKELTQQLEELERTEIIQLRWASARGQESGDRT
jgi:V/A-type H+-transporting ATPase subunit D